jgi:hypothetical protein
MTVRYVPRDQDGVISLAQVVLPGLQSIGEIVGIAHNDASAVATDLYDLIGQPGAGLSAGKQGQLNLKRDAYNAAINLRRAAVAAARKFNGDAIDLLKGHLGRTWNTRWQAAGFTRGTLRLPNDPLPLLVELRGYFVLHAAHENAATQITATRADALAAAVNDAVHDENVARTERNTAADVRDAAFVHLRRRLVAVRRELEDLLEDDDQRWTTFGFSRPVDRRIPKAVIGLTLRPGGVAGEIIVEWEPSVGAANYRVSRQVLTVDVEPVEVGLFSDRMVIIGDLPSGKTVRVTVTARNEAGETLPASSLITIA